MLQDFLLAPEVFWDQDFPKLGKDVQWLVPYLLIFAGSMLIAGLMSLSSMGRSPWAETLQKAAQHSAIIWIVATLSYSLLPLGILLMLHLLGLYSSKPLHRLFVELLWAQLPLALLMFPLGFLLAWVGLITTGVWIHLRFQPSLWAWLRLVGWTIWIGGTGVYGIWTFLIRAAQLNLWLHLRNLLEG